MGHAFMDHGCQIGGWIEMGDRVANHNTMIGPVLMRPSEVGCRTF